MMHDVHAPIFIFGVCVPLIMWIINKHFSVLLLVSVDELSVHYIHCDC